MFNQKKLLMWSIGGLVLIGAVPIFIQQNMNGYFSTTPGGSDDGWLGFWGGYIGAVVTIVGLYITILFQRQENINNDIRNGRPYIYSMTQTGIRVNDHVYHSTTSVNFQDIANRLFQLSNLTTNPAVNIIFVIFNGQEIVDMIIVPTLVKGTVAIDYRRQSEDRVTKIEIAFQTTKREFGLYVQILNDGSKYSYPNTVWGSDAEKRHKEFEMWFTYHNRAAKGASDKWNTNLSIFSDKDVRYYNEALKKLNDLRLKELGKSQNQDK